jgi:hypothetical protein
VSAVNERDQNLDDMWALNLSLPTQPGQCPTFHWERVPNKGTVPPRCSGAASCVYKNRIILFGGVSDTETSNDVVGTFYNTLHAFDMDRRRWFSLSVGGRSGKSKRKGESKEKRRVKKEATTISNSLDTLTLDGTSDGEIEDDEGAYEYAGIELDENSFYVIIDGKLTKVDIEDDEMYEQDECFARSGEAETSQAPVSIVSKGEINVGPEGVVTEQSSPENIIENTNAETAVPSATMGVPCLPGATDAEDNPDLETSLSTTTAPTPRIGSGIASIGSKLFIFGGTTEISEEQITFDDLWVVDLNKLDAWTQVVQGKWTETKWKGNDSDSEDDEGDDMVFLDGEEDEMDSSDDEDGTKMHLLELGKLEQKSENDITIRLKKLQERLKLTDESSTPLPKEPLRDFFRRTCEVWIRKMFDGLSREEKLSGKEIRSKAFQLSRARFDELFPFLQQLDELEEQQKIAEEMQEQEKSRLLDKLKSKAKKRKVHMAKIAKKEKRKTPESSVDEND